MSTEPTEADCDRLRRCEPRMAGGTKIEASTDRSDEPWDM